MVNEHVLINMRVYIIVYRILSFWNSLYKPILYYVACNIGQTPCISSYNVPIYPQLSNQYIETGV